MTDPTKSDTLSRILWAIGIVAFLAGAVWAAKEANHG